MNSFPPTFSLRYDIKPLVHDDVCRVSDDHSNCAGESMLHDRLDRVENKSGEDQSQDLYCEICPSLQKTVDQL